jgi:hypothetical protein
MAPAAIDSFRDARQVTIVNFTFKHQKCDVVLQSFKAFEEVWMDYDFLDFIALVTSEFDDQV